MKPDEVLLLHALRTAQPLPYKATQNVEEVFARLGMNEKRGYRILEKWTRKRWWDYGVSLRTGWFTPEAPTTETIGDAVSVR